MHCTNCGKELVAEAKFCDGCGTPIVAEQSANPAPAAAPAEPAAPAAPAEPAAAQSAPAAQEGQENKVIFILSYLLFFLPLIACPGSKTGRFHANQGLILLIASVAGQILVTILSSILIAISWRLWSIASLLGWAWAIVVLVFVVIGMINANKGEQKPLPVIGKFTIIK